MDTLNLGSLPGVLQKKSNRLFSMHISPISVWITHESISPISVRKRNENEKQALSLKTTSKIHSFGTMSLRRVLLNLKAENAGPFWLAFQPLLVPDTGPNRRHWLRSIVVNCNRAARRPPCTKCSAKLEGPIQDGPKIESREVYLPKCICVYY